MRTNKFIHVPHTLCMYLDYKKEKEKVNILDADFCFFFFFISILDADLISPTRKDHINQIKHFVTRTKKEKER